MREEGRKSDGSREIVGCGSSHSLPSAVLWGLLMRVASRPIAKQPLYAQGSQAGLLPSRQLGHALPPEEPLSRSSIADRRAYVFRYG